ncbi:MAG: hypothetical protein WCI71_13445, partial [Bacteroidota bacterium]
FTNGRFMKSPYLHHAIENAYQELISKESIPSYFIFLEVDPHTIDVNIHPTKTEINFQDIKSLYAILFAAVKQSIGKFSLSPSLDFEVEHSMDMPSGPSDKPIRQPSITITPGYNPFEKHNRTQNQFSFPSPSGPSISALNDLYKNIQPGQNPDTARPTKLLDDEPLVKTKQSFQLLNSFIITHSQTGVIVIDQQHAHERILYERFINQTDQEEISGQHLLIPVTIHLSPDDLHFFMEWRNHFINLGFEISNFGKDSLIVSSVPPVIKSSNIEELIESILESLKSSPPDHRFSGMQLLARALARKAAVKRGKNLQPEEIHSIIEGLFACKVPEISPDGKLTMVILSLEELKQKFKI